MDYSLTIIDPIQIRRLDLFMTNIIDSINEKNVFSKFFTPGKLTKNPTRPNRRIIIDIMKIFFDERNLRRKIQADIFKHCLLQFKLLIRVTATGYNLSLNLYDEDRTFPPQSLLRSLGITRVEVTPYSFAHLEVAPSYDVTNLRTFLTNKTFQISLPIPLCNIALTTQHEVLTLKYRDINEAGYTPADRPQLDHTETTILDSIANRHLRTSSPLSQSSPIHSSQRQTRPTTRRTDENTRQRQNDTSSPPPPYRAPSYLNVTAPEYLNSHRTDPNTRGLSGADMMSHDRAQ